MQKFQIYIGDDRLDLFKDESITVTQSIQNVKQIDKIFTEFSQTFLFQHHPPITKFSSITISMILSMDMMQGLNLLVELSLIFLLGEMAS